jgi:flagellar hook-associated protein FlgK
LFKDNSTLIHTNNGYTLVEGNNETRFSEPPSFVKEKVKIHSRFTRYFLKNADIAAEQTTEDFVYVQRFQRSKFAAFFRFNTGDIQILF